MQGQLFLDSVVGAGTGASAQSVQGAVTDASLDSTLQSHLKYTMTRDTAREYVQSLFAPVAQRPVPAVRHTSRDDRTRSIHYWKQPTPAPRKIDY